MTTTTALPNGDKGVIGSPTHLLLRRMAASVTGWVPRGTGATTTQLRALEREGWAVRTYDREGLRLIVSGAHLTPRGERYVEMLDAAQARQDELEKLR